VEYVVPAGELPTVEVRGTTARFPVHRIYCVGRNYGDHVAEMGNDPKKPPIFFSKPSDAIVASGAEIPYPSATENFHHELELVIAIGSGGADIPTTSALDHVYGYGIGVDLTRRDLQAAAKNAGTPWDVAKGFDQSAPCGVISPVSEIGHPLDVRIWLTVNGELRQETSTGAMIYGVAETIAELSKLYMLAPGDLIYTGTPAGVGPLDRGDQVACGGVGLEGLDFSIV
jgi:fumarylpyruvate hydrolase